MRTPGTISRDNEKKTVQAFTSETAPRAAEYGPFPALIDGITWTSNGKSNDKFPSGWSNILRPLAEPSRNPRIVRNIFPQTTRFTTASAFGTGVGTPTTGLVNQYGVLNGTINLDSGSAGRCFVATTLTLVAGQWYAISFEIVSMSIGTGADCGLSTNGGTATIDVGSGAITGASIVAGGIGRYAAMFMSRAGGTLIFRFGVGLNSNAASKTMLLKNLQFEKIDSTDGLRPGEYVYPQFRAAFDYKNPCSVDINGKVTQSTPINRFSVRPYSNILVVGDSRNDEPANIAGQLDTLLGYNGAVHIYASGGWTTANAIGPTTQSIGQNNYALTIDKALSGSLLRQTFSTVGDEQYYNITENSYPFDTIYISDFGYNDTSDTTNGAATAFSNIKIICDKAVSLGMRVILSDNNPFKAHVTYSTARLAAVKSLNQMLMTYAAENGFLYVSTYGSLGDSTDQDKLSDGAGTTPNYSQDALHLNDTGSTLVATATKALIDNYR